MDLGLGGRIAVVTGGSKGIGLAVVRGLVANDVHVTWGPGNPPASSTSWRERARCRSPRSTWPGPPDPPG